MLGAILIIEDDPEVRQHLQLFLTEAGYQTSAAVDGQAALGLLAQGKLLPPDLVLADYNLPNGMNGVQVAHRLRQELHREIPFIVLTGDISIETLRDIALHDCVHLHKPVKLKDLTRAIEKLLANPPEPRVVVPHQTFEAASPLGGATIIIVDDEDLVREAIRAVLEDDGRVVESYPNCEAFLEAFNPGKSACLLVDAYLPGMSGLELLEKLRSEGHHVPAIMITGNADVHMAVQAMKAGALDFIEKPIGREELIASIERALELSQDSEQIGEAARIGDDSPRGSHRTAARGHGPSAGRPAQQKHCRRSQDQPAHGRKPPRRNHEENRVEVAARPGPVGASRFGQDREAVDSVEPAASDGSGSDEWERLSVG